MPLFDIDLSTIEDGVNRYGFEAAPEALELEEEGCVYRRTVSVKAKITRTGAMLTVEGGVSTSVERTCARCLEPFEDGIDTAFFEAARMEGETIRVLDDQYDGDPGFLNTSPGVLTIDPLVREAVLVSSPMKPVCRVDCRGLCPQCGIDRNKNDCDCVVENVHPAWQALRDLKQDLEKKE